MNEFKKGDKIIITAVGEKPINGRYFWKGDIGVIRSIYQDTEATEAYVDFDNQGNKKVYGDGQWYISSDVTRDDDRYAQFKLYEEPEVIDWTEHEGKEAWFSISGGTKEWFKGKLYKYDPELTPSFLAILDKDQDTIRQFNYIKTYGEIDWSKIPVGTKVIVSDNPDFSEPETKEFLCYSPDRGYPFRVVAGGCCSKIANAYKYCKLAMERFENAKIGDAVFCEVYGDGKVVSCRDSLTYRILVEFMSSARESYTLDGRMHKKAIKPTLFYRKGTERNLTERPAEEKPQEIDWTKVVTGTQVIVSDSENFYPSNTREFFMHRPDLEYKFWVFDGEKDEAYGYKYCKIV